MTGQSKPDKDRDVISLSTAKRTRHSEFLEALERALEATKPLTEMATIAPLQPEQEQFELAEPDGLQSDAPRYDRLPSADAPAESKGGETLVRQRPERARLRIPDSARARPQWLPPDRATALQAPIEPAPIEPAPIEPVPAERPQGERSRDSHLPPEFPGSEFVPFDRQPHNAMSGPVGLEEQRMREQFIEMLRQRQQSAMHEPAQQSQASRRPVVAMFGRLALAGAVAFACTFLAFRFIGANPQTQDPSNSATAVASLVPHLPAFPQDKQPAARPTGQLVLTALSGAANRPVALGVNVEAAPPGAFVLIKGLPSGSRITAGSAAGDGGWRVPVRDLGHAAVMPPADFVGAMSLSVDLSLADGTVTDSDVLQLKWTRVNSAAIEPTPVKTKTIVASRPPQPASAAIPQAVPPEVAKAPAGKPRAVGADAAAGARKLDAEEMEKLLNRAEKFLQDRDIAAARLLLRRAAEAGDMHAAIALAATYDPVILKQLGALGARADIARARAWYQKASELGSAEAKLRLQRLSQDSP